MQGTQPWQCKEFRPELYVGGTCKEFSPLFHQLAEDNSALKFGQVDIDEPEGMQLAVSTGAIEEGVPSVRMFKRAGDRVGDLVWAGDEVPPYESLAEALLATV